MPDGRIELCDEAQCDVEECAGASDSALRLVLSSLPLIFQCAFNRFVGVFRSFCDVFRSFQRLFNLFVVESTLHFSAVT